MNVSRDKCHGQHLRRRSVEGASLDCSRHAPCRHRSDEHGRVRRAIDGAVAVGGVVALEASLAEARGEGGPASALFDTEKLVSAPSFGSRRAASSKSGNRHRWSFPSVPRMQVSFSNKSSTALPSICRPLSLSAFRCARVGSNSVNRRHPEAGCSLLTYAVDLNILHFNPLH